MAPGFMGHLIHPPHDDGAAASDPDVAGSRIRARPMPAVSRLAIEMRANVAVLAKPADSATGVVTSSWNRPSAKGSGRQAAGHRRWRSARTPNPMSPMSVSSTAMPYMVVAADAAAPLTFAPAT